MAEVSGAPGAGNRDAQRMGEVGGLRPHNIVQGLLRLRWFFWRSQEDSETSRLLQKTLIIKAEPTSSLRADGVLRVALPVLQHRCNDVAVPRIAVPSSVFAWLAVY